MKYMNKQKRDDVIRNYDIDMAIEDYMGDQRKHIFNLLDEIETYPAGLQKTLFNYKKNYDDEQEMFSREIVHMYRTGETDPDLMLAQLMKRAYENPSSDEDENDTRGDDTSGAKKFSDKRPRNPNLTYFKKKQE